MHTVYKIIYSTENTFFSTNSVPEICLANKHNNGGSAVREVATGVVITGMVSSVASGKEMKLI